MTTHLSIDGDPLCDSFSHDDQDTLSEDSRKIDCDDCCLDYIECVGAVWNEADQVFRPTIPEGEWMTRLRQRREENHAE